MRMSRKQYRIGDIAKQLNVQPFVLRFWEKELNIKPRRSQGGQRFYQTDDFEIFHMVKILLYDHKFTLAGAKQKLAELKKQKTKVILTKKIESPATQNQSAESALISAEMQAKILAFKEQLTKLKSLL